MQKLKYAYINSKSFSPFCVNHQQRGEIKQVKNKDKYAIYIHEERDVKLAPLHTCITEEGMTKP